MLLKHKGVSWRPMATDARIEDKWEVVSEARDYTNPHQIPPSKAVLEMAVRTKA